MKKINIIYWIFTGLLILLMGFSAVGSFMPPSKERAAMMAQIGYPAYVFKMLAVAKILGIIALLVPGFPKIKEWAYAGFTFDILGALVSFIITGSPVTGLVPMIIGIAIIAVSYIYWHKKLALKA